MGQIFLMWRVGFPWKIFFRYNFARSSLFKPFRVDRIKKKSEKIVRSILEKYQYCHWGLSETPKLTHSQITNVYLQVDQVIVGEDCSIPESELGRAGKRALPGIVLVIKVAGALAFKGHNLSEIKKLSQSVAHNMASCSIGLTACTVPANKKFLLICH